MADINELTARLKAAAQDEIMCREACDTSDAWHDAASPENVLALTEALEAADKHVAYLEERHDDLVRQARSFREAHESASEIIRQLEARVLTVKMPTTKYQWGGGMLNTIDPVDMLTALRSACSDAGIKLQIEGE